MENQIGIRIKNLRKQHGYKTQEDLADALRTRYGLKTDRPMVSKWETGYQTPEIYTVKCLANLFGVTMDYLSGEDTPALGELSADDLELLNRIHHLTEDNRSKLSELIDLFLSAQGKTKETP